MFLVSSCSYYCKICWIHVLSQEWRCSWSSVDGRCSNYIWVINNFTTYHGAPYIREFTVWMISFLRSSKTPCMANGYHITNANSINLYFIWKVKSKWVFVRLLLEIHNPTHDDFVPWNLFLQYWPFLSWIHSSPRRAPKAIWRSCDVTIE